MLEVKDIEPLHCLTCDNEITQLTDFQNTQPVKKGNIVICGECAAIHKVGDAGLIKFTKEDFSGLDQQSRDQIGKLVTSILKNNAQRGQRN